MKKYKSNDIIKIILFYGGLLTAMLAFALLQPLGEPPDESGRYLIVQYICLHGRLPHGADPEISLFGYGGSYAFQPILTYIIQGWLLRFLFRFCRDGYLLLLAARLVNVAFGMIMAFYVRKISKLLFRSEGWQWLFSVAVMFLPQSLFLHTYVNTDSMAMMSTAMMVYAWLTGMAKRWDLSSCLTLSAGISLCALSYYNAYGFILCSIFIFVYTFVERDASGRLRLDWKSMLRRGALISAVVLLCIGWWFIRNAVLYNGDFLGLRARAECALNTATEKYHPLTKETYQNMGYSLAYMIFKTDFLELLINSTIATFGPMSIVTFRHIYTVFKWLFLISLGLAALLPRRYAEKPLPRFAAANLLLCILIPVVLCTGYSYMSDYQPQGRYILPMLVPFAYFCTLGLQKLLALLLDKVKQEKGRLRPFLPPLAAGAVICFYQYALWATLFFVVLPVYYPSSILYYIRSTF